MKESLKRYKYIHIFFHYDLIYSKKMITMFTDENNNFDKSEHHFATCHQNVYDKFKDICDIEYIEYGKANPSKMINELAERADWLFFNAMCSPSKFLGVKNKNLGKIIWRTWGHDAAGVRYYPNKKFGNLIKKVFLHKKRWNKKISKIKAIGCAGIVDVINLHSRFPNVPMIFYPYLDEISISEFNKTKGVYKKQDKTVRVILGHSTTPTDNHKGMLKELQKFAGEDLEVYMPMTYGFAPYRQEIHDFIKKENITLKYKILEDMMSYKEYFDFMRNADIFILDATFSCALGNIYMALHMSKKVFLNKDGVIKKAFDVDNIPHCTTDQIKDMSFSEFSKPFEYDATNSTLSLASPEKSVKEWHNILAYLNGTGEIEDLCKKIKEN